jgi:hypothetical protein
MVEDSMKNIRAAKALGMKTILITGSSLSEDGRDLLGDAPSTKDPDDVDIAFQTIEEMKIKLPGLWQNPSVFEPEQDSGYGAVNCTTFWGPLLRGHISLKNWTYCPLLRESASPFKSTCLLITLVKISEGCFVWAAPALV